MTVAETMAAATGVVLGGTVMLLWVATRRLGEDRFWPAFRQLARDLAAGAPPETILRQYAEMIRLLALYLGKTTCRIGITILPVVLCCTLLGPVAFDAALRTANGVTVYPVQTVHVMVGDRLLAFESARGELVDPAQCVPVTGGTLTLDFEIDGLAALLDEVEQSAALTIATAASEVVVPAWTAPVAVSSSPWTCLGLQLLGMEAHYMAEGPPLLIVRPSGVGDSNPLYPYVSDLELAFWSGLLGSSLMMGLAFKLAGKRAKQS